MTTELWKCSKTVRGEVLNKLKYLSKQIQDRKATIQINRNTIEYHEHELKKLQEEIDKLQKEYKL